MYIVGQAYNPEDMPDASCWTLEIHNIVEDDNSKSHWACILIYADTMDLCLLKAKIICDTLNTKGFAAHESMIEILNITQELDSKNE